MVNFQSDIALLFYSRKTKSYCIGSFWLIKIPFPTLRSFRFKLCDCVLQKRLSTKPEISTRLREDGLADKRPALQDSHCILKNVDRGSFDFVL